MISSNEQSDPNWWHGAVIYHVYPRSFLDTTGNGVGDLRGICSKLDHIESLGVDALWISPFVTSPMRDFGYDVSDYRRVDPLFGTNADFSDLLKEAHDRGLRVLMDQVFSHTSDQHPWFQQSRQSRDNPHADWYVWADPKQDGSPPNNWLSVFGGSSWQWEPRRSQYYLHNFLREQPDLNFHNPDVQEAILDIARYWLDLGVDGFRLDVCAFYFHNRDLTDNPANPSRPTGSHFLFNPYSLQIHEHDIGQPENLAFLERLRSLCDGYGDRLLLGELHESHGDILHKTYTAPGRLHLAYGYWLLGADRIDADTIKDTITLLGYTLDSGWPAWAVDNHDFARSPTRLGYGDEASLILLAALTCVRGALCLYQGAELGLEQANIPEDRLIDPYGREFYPAFPGRDGARTPMPWKDDVPHAGFSTVEPWLPVADEHLARAVNRQEQHSGSMLNRMKKFLNWRIKLPALRGGTMTIVDSPKDCLVIERRSETENLIAAFNFGPEELSLDLPEFSGLHPLDGHGFSGYILEGQLRLPPFDAFFGSQS